MGLSLEFWRAFDSFQLITPGTPWDLALAGVYILGFCWGVWMCRADFERMNRVKWGLFSLGLAALLPANMFFTLFRHQSGLSLVSPLLPELAVPLTLPLLVLAIIGLLGAVFGAGPGLVAGLVAGLLRAWFYAQLLNDVAIFVLWGGLLGFFLNQSYKGRLFDALRWPLTAMLAAAIGPLFVLCLNRFAFSIPSGWVVALDYAFAPLAEGWLIWAINGCLQGGVFLLLFKLFPNLRPRPRANVVSMFGRSLRMRFMVVLIPLLIAGIVISVVVVTNRAVLVARQQALAEMSRSAENASDGILHFYYTGFNLLEQFATNHVLLDPVQRTEVLRTNRLIIPNFQEMMLTDATGNVVAAVPADMLDPALTFEEQTLVVRALELGMSGVTRLTVLPSGERRMTFIQPVLGDADGLPVAVLLGRVDLEPNPGMSRALEALQATQERGTGFIMDDRRVIIADSRHDSIMHIWNPNADSVRFPVAAGTAYEDLSSEGERMLTYEREVEGAPYRLVLVMSLPYSAVLDTATTISSPLLISQLLTGLILLLVIPLLATQITRPLQTLADATHQIAQGNLGVPVRISGDDEVSLLGRAFDQMRLRLQDRLNDLSLLLRVSQSVSATLDLDEGIPLILEGALEETGASVARFVLMGTGDRIQQVFSAGIEDGSLPGLDRAFAAALYRRREPLVTHDLPRGNTGSVFSGPLKSVAAFPVRTHNRTAGILGLGSSTERAVDEARVNFLSTLVTQAVSLVENTHLFQAAEGGRQRLEAILDSTADAILVTDHEDRLLLINPAAQRILGLDDTTYGRPLEELNLPTPLEESLRRPLSDQHPGSPVEVPMSDGRTFYVSVAPIRATEGRLIGRVAVMRDVTHFKELDEMKSDFVATVSHDLRAPLTFIRGYTTMLAMVGELNDKQRDYMERILKGIDQMSALIDDLLNLRRIEAGVGIRQAPCHLGLVLVEAVDTMRARAVGKGITLRLEPTEGSPTIIGDRTLLRQSIGNLVDNAIKYTPGGGQVSVGMVVNHAAGEVVIHIADSGIGIAPEDQVRLFEKFYRIKRRETTDTPGTGLGLALVKGIVEHHGGRVWVESTLNQGSTFYIALPLPPEEQ